jgi:DNA (cytosine-5)-methyltransferase 1
LSKANVLSLFSGVGGFDLGLEQAGMTTIYQCEWDKNASSVLQRHWPDIPKWGDVSTLTATEILQHGNKPDIIAWGSPCQDLSIAGKRAGLEGDRSSLFYEGIRIIKELRKETNNEYPRVSIWENVAGSITSNKGADFGVILNEMAEAGALVIEWAVLDAQYFGVPQRRRRVFVIAIFDPAIARDCPDPILPVSQSLPGDFEKSEQKKQTAPNETATGFRSNNYAQYTEGVGTLRSNGGDLRGGSETLITEPMLSFDTKFGSNANVFENQSPTLKASQSAPSVQHDLTIRRMTPLECERLMGWPDNWTEGQTNAQRYKQCGNGVASPVAKWIGEKINAIMS